MSSSDDFSEISGALGSVGLSAVILLGGEVLSRVMGFVTRIVMTRFLPVNGYGEVVLGITVLNVLAIISLVGLNEAMSRHIPRTESAQEQTEVVGTISIVVHSVSVMPSLTYSAR